MAQPSRSYSAGLLPLPSQLSSPKDFGSAIDSNDDAVSNGSHRKSGSSALPPSRSPSQRREYIDDLLGKDLSSYRGKDKLYDYCKVLQVVGREQRDEIARLEVEVAANLVPSPSAGSTRRTTDESKLSQPRNQVLDPTRKGIAVVYNSTLNVLDILQRRDMDDSLYIKADLPSFHWWNDTLHVYFDKTRDKKSIANGRPEVIVLKKLLDDPASQNRRLDQSVNLGKLGWRIRFLRVARQLKVIYIVSPQQFSEKLLVQQPRSPVQGRKSSR